MVTSAQDVVVGRVRSSFINGAHWLVWDSGTPRTLHASRVSTEGIVPAVWPDGFSLVPPAAAVATTQLPAIAAGSNSGLVTWVQMQANPSTLTALRGMPVFRSARDDRTPADIRIMHRSRVPAFPRIESKVSTAASVRLRTAGRDPEWTDRCSCRVGQHVGRLRRCS